MAANLVGIAFIPYYQHLMKILETNSELKRTAKGIFKQAGYSFAGAAIGGAVGGPPGALLGGITGAVAGYMSVDPYDSLLNVLRNMSEEEKKELTKNIQELVGSTSIEALTEFVKSQVQRELLLKVVRDFAGAKGGG